MFAREPSVYDVSPTAGVLPGRGVQRVAVKPRSTTPPDAADVDNGLCDVVVHSVVRSVSPAVATVTEVDSRIIAAPSLQGVAESWAHPGAGDVPDAVWAAAGAGVQHHTVECVFAEAESDEDEGAPVDHVAAVARVSCAVRSFCGDHASLWLRRQHVWQEQIRKKAGRDSELVKSVLATQAGAQERLSKLQAAAAAAPSEPALDVSSAPSMDPPPGIMDLLIKDGSPLPEDRLTQEDIAQLRAAKAAAEPAAWLMWQARAHRLLASRKPEAARAAEELLRRATAAPNPVAGDDSDGEQSSLAPSANDKPDGDAAWQQPPAARPATTGPAQAAEQHPPTVRLVKEGTMHVLEGFLRGGAPEDLRSGTVWVERHVALTTESLAWYPNVASFRRAWKEVQVQGGRTSDVADAASVAMAVRGADVALGAGAAARGCPPPPSSHVFRLSTGKGKSTKSLLMCASDWLEMTAWYTALSAAAAGRADEGVSEEAHSGSDDEAEAPRAVPDSEPAAAPAADVVSDPAASATSSHTDASAVPRKDAEAPAVGAADAKRWLPAAVRRSVDSGDDLDPDSDSHGEAKARGSPVRRGHGEVGAEDKRPEPPPPSRSLTSLTAAQKARVAAVAAANDARERGETIGPDGVAFRAREGRAPPASPGRPARWGGQQRGTARRPRRSLSAEPRRDHPALAARPPTAPPGARNRPQTTKRRGRSRTRRGVGPRPQSPSPNSRRQRAREAARLDELRGVRPAAAAELSEASSFVYEDTEPSESEGEGRRAAPYRNGPWREEGEPEELMGHRQSARSDDGYVSGDRELPVRRMPQQQGRSGGAARRPATSRSPTRTRAPEPVWRRPPDIEVAGVGASGGIADRIPRTPSPQAKRRGLQGGSPRRAGPSNLAAERASTSSGRSPAGRRQQGARRGRGGSAARRPPSRRYQRHGTQARSTSPQRSRQTAASGRRPLYQLPPRREAEPPHRAADQSPATAAIQRWGLPEGVRRFAEDESHLHAQEEINALERLPAAVSEAIASPGVSSRPSEASVLVDQLVMVEGRLNESERMRLALERRVADLERGHRGGVSDREDRSSVGYDSAHDRSDVAELAAVARSVGAAAEEAAQAAVSGMSKPRATSPTSWRDAHETSAGMPSQVGDSGSHRSGHGAFERDDDADDGDVELATLLRDQAAAVARAEAAARKHDLDTHDHGSNTDDSFASRRTWGTGDDAVARRVEALDARVAALADALHAERERRRAAEAQLEDERNTLRLFMEEIGESGPFPDASKAAARDLAGKVNHAREAVHSLRDTVRASFEDVASYLRSAAAAAESVQGRRDLQNSRMGASQVGSAVKPDAKPTDKDGDESAAASTTPFEEAFAEAVGVTPEQTDRSGSASGAATETAAETVPGPPDERPLLSPAVASPFGGVRSIQAPDGASEPLEVTTPRDIEGLSPFDGHATVHYDEWGSPRSGADGSPVGRATEASWRSSKGDTASPSRSLWAAQVPPPRIRHLCQVTVVGEDPSRVGYSSALDSFCLGDSGASREGMVLHVPSPTAVELRARPGSAGSGEAIQAFRFARVVRSPVDEALAELGRLIAGNVAAAVSERRPACVVVAGAAAILPSKLETLFGEEEAVGLLRRSVDAVFQQCVVDRRDNVFSLEATATALLCAPSGLADLLAPPGQDRPQPRPQWLPAEGDRDAPGSVFLANAVAVRVNSSTDFARVADVVEARSRAALEAHPGGDDAPSVVISLEVQTRHFVGRSAESGTGTSRLRGGPSGGDWVSRACKATFVLLQGALPGDSSSSEGDRAPDNPVDAAGDVLRAVSAASAGYGDGAAVDKSSAVPYGSSRLTSLLRDVLTPETAIDVVHVVSPELSGTGTVDALSFAARLQDAVGGSATGTAPPRMGRSGPTPRSQAHHRDRGMDTSGAYSWVGDVPQRPASAAGRDSRWR